jgi:hypothetical protein
MDDKIRRIRCSTRKCVGFLDTRVSTEPKSRDGNWQFLCATCNFWNLAAANGVIKATSNERFDLDRLSYSQRTPTVIRREPPGGV